MRSVYLIISTIFGVGILAAGVDCCRRSRSRILRAAPLENVSDYVKSLYDGVSGYGIPLEERETIIGHGGEPTYGEITPEGVSLLIAEFGMKEGDVFYDLGSGVGKVAVQVYLEVPVKKSVGIELSKTRHDCGESVVKKLRQEGRIQRGRSLLLVCDDILAHTYKDATHIYTASLCFSDEFMEKLTAHLAHGKKGLMVASLRVLPEGYGFELIAVKQMPMTWSDDTPVYFYRLVRKKR